MKCLLTTCKPTENELFGHSIFLFIKYFIQMKTILFFLLLTPIYVLAQPDTEVFLMDIDFSEENFSISNFKNISNNKGYDNQPSFLNNQTLIFGKNNGKATDIATYNISENTTQWYHPTTLGGEYSPQAIPNTNHIAAVRLDPDGKQRLYIYTPTGSKELIKDVEVAYYAFHDDKKIVASILANGQLDLVIIDIPQQKTHSYIENTGRSIHKIPNTNSVSYTTINEQKNHDIYTLNIDETGESFFICQLPEGVQDYAWLNKNTLICGYGDQLFFYDLFGDGQWKKAANLFPKSIKNITRLAMSPNGKQMALVAEKVALTTGKIVQKHIEPFNRGDLEAFVNCFSEDVIVRNFPNRGAYRGRSKLKEDYQRFYKNNTDWNVKVVNRITLGNMVIDEEVSTVSGKEQHQATIYKIANGTIASMTFIQGGETPKKVEKLIDKQIKAYNNRDINAFMKLYSEDIELYNFPHQLTSEGKEPMRKSFGSFFENTPNLHTEIKNRISVGNYIIDQEYVTYNNRNLNAIAIYKVEGNKIVTVTFIQ